MQHNDPKKESHNCKEQQDDEYILTEIYFFKYTIIFEYF